MDRQHIPEATLRKAIKVRATPKGRSVDATALAEVRALLGDAPRRRDLLIEHLHRIQDQYHCLADRHIVALAHEMNLPVVEVFEVASFYHHFDVVKESEAAPASLTVRVCDTLSCAMAGSEALMARLKTLLGQDVRVIAAPCVGRCQAAPAAIVGRNAIDNATPERVMSAVSGKHIVATIPDYVALDAYRAQGGYETWRACVGGQREIERVIKEMEESNLRGLGGAGFPAGRKWRIVRGEAAPRLMAVNIDEGEPGTFKDRFYLESDPHRFIEGMLIAAWAVSIDECYVYLRDEYPACHEILVRELDAVEAAAKSGFAAVAAPAAADSARAEHVWGGFAMPNGVRFPTIHLRRGAGAYICGEESAMIESIEGKRGMPRLRPPYVAQVGLFDRPTLEHNMETLWWVRDILEKGAAWFAGHGRRGRKGLRSFSVSGRVNKPGVHLAPAGITVKELIDEYCGGMQAGHTFYAYLPGGASGGILPASMGDIALDFDTLQPYGCFIGSAAVIILSQHDKARDAALNLTRFFHDESCGQCTPCRVGTEKAVRLMEESRWRSGMLEELSQAMADASICGLGQAAPNPIRCVVKHFGHEVS